MVALVLFATIVLVMGGSLAGALSDVDALFVFDWVQLAAQVVAVLGLFAVVRAVGGGHLSGYAWRLLLAGIITYMVGQICINVLRLQLGTGDVPFPALPDVFFVIGQTLFAAGLWCHVVAYVRTGFPTGGLLGYALMYGLVSAGASVCVVYLLVPLWSDPNQTEGMRWMTSAYEGYDFITLCAALALLRFALIFKGGAIAIGWAAVALAFVFMMIGDLLFGLRMENYSGFPFLMSYGLLAYGALRHQEVLARI
jgi:hypothetical protein